MPASSPLGMSDASSSPDLDCPDLRRLFGDHYKIGCDTAQSVGRGSRLDDPWLLVVRCRWGHVYVHGRDRLGVATNTRGNAARQISSIPGVRVLQDADDGINAVFPVELFERVAAIVKPLRRRRLSPENRERLVAMGKVNLNMANSAHVGFSGEPRIRPICVPDDSGHVQAAPRAAEAALA
jgi:hypothetical protein